MTEQQGFKTIRENLQMLETALKPHPELNPDASLLNKLQQQIRDGISACYQAIDDSDITNATIYFAYVQGMLASYTEVFEYSVHSL